MRQFYKPTNVKIGARIRMARESARLTREEFSEQVDISAQFLTDIERGRMGASLETIIKICDVLGVTTDTILRGPDSQRYPEGIILDGSGIIRKKQSHKRLP